MTQWHNPKPGTAPKFDDSVWRAADEDTKVWERKIPQGAEYRFFETTNFGWIHIRDPKTQKLLKIIKL